MYDLNLAKVNLNLVPSRFERATLFFIKYIEFLSRDNPRRNNDNTSTGTKFSSMYTAVLNYLSYIKYIYTHGTGTAVRTAQ